MLTYVDIYDVLLGVKHNDIIFLEEDMSLFIC